VLGRKVLRSIEWASNSVKSGVSAETGCCFDATANNDECLLQAATYAVTAVGMQRTKPKLFDDNPYISNTPSPTSVNIRGIVITLLFNYHADYLLHLLRRLLSIIR